jgi:hypothetical protein
MCCKDNKFKLTRICFKCGKKAVGSTINPITKKIRSICKDYPKCQV